jgi:hypothetical protein
MEARVRRFRWIGSMVVLLALAACAPRLAPPGGGEGGPAPPAAVERFLQLAAAKDYRGMGWVFGTADGPIMRLESPNLAEQRMFGLAVVLEHDGFVVGNGSAIPGRTRDAMRFDVAITRGTQSYRVPFTVVRGPQDRWFVEVIDIEAITRR